MTPDVTAPAEQPAREARFFGTDAFEAGGSLPGQPIVTPTEPKPGSDEAYRLQARLQAENRLVATLHGRSDPCRCPDCAASPVLVGHPEPWFRETPESLALLEAERAEVAAVEARAGRPPGDRETFDRRAGEEEAQAELLGHRPAVGETAERPEER